MVYLFFGDSIVQGAWDEEGGWATRLTNFIHNSTVLSDFKEYHLAFNLGISGDTTSDILDRLESEILARQDDEISIVFGIGVNDSQYFIDEQEFKTSPEQFENNLEKIIEISKTYTDKITFIGLLPVDDTKTDPTPWTPGKSYKLENVEIYNEIIKKICDKENCLFIDVLTTFLNKDYKQLLIDGLHPNTEGHKLLFELIKNRLLKE